MLENFESAGGVQFFAIVGITNDGATFTQVTEGVEYRALLGALEHLKLKYFLDNAL